MGATIYSHRTISRNRHPSDVTKHSKSTTETEDEMEGALLLNVIVGKRTTIFELLASEDQALLVGGNTLLVLDLGLDVVNGIRGLDLKRDGLSRQSLDEDLHTAAETEDWERGISKRSRAHRE